MANRLICLLSSLALMFVSLSQSSQAYQFIVGGKDGWVLNPSESYSQWAGRSRFSVNDTLLFRYTKGSDSVLVVNKDDFDNCNTGNPIQKFDDGNSVFKYDRSGPFYFITGTKENCDKGQKLVTVVLAIRSPPPPPSPNGPPSSPPVIAPSSPPVVAPSSPPVIAPSSPPVIAPSSPPVIAPSSPPSETSPSPDASPDQSPSPANQVSSPPPSSPEGNLSPPSTTTTPPGASVPGAGNTTTGGNTPAGPSSFAAPACSPTAALVLVVSVVLSLNFGGFVISP